MGKNLSSAKTVMEVAESPENQEPSSDEILQPSRTLLDIVKEKWPLPVFVLSILLLIVVVFFVPESGVKTMPAEDYLQLAEKEFLAQNYDQVFVWTTAYKDIYHNKPESMYKRVLQLEADSHYHMFLKSYLATEHFDKAKELYSTLQKEQWTTANKITRGEWLLMQARLGQLYLNRALNFKAQQTSSDVVRPEYLDLLNNSLLAYTVKPVNQDSLIDYYAGLQQHNLREEREGSKPSPAPKGVGGANKNAAQKSPVVKTAEATAPVFSIEAEGSDFEKQIFQNLIKVYELLLEATPRQTKDKDGNYLALQYASQINSHLGYLVNSQDKNDVEALGALKMRSGRAALLLAQLEWMRFELDLRKNAVTHAVAKEKIQREGEAAVGGPEEAKNHLKNYKEASEKLHTSWGSIFDRLQNACNLFQEINHDQSGKPIGEEAGFEVGETLFYFMQYASNLKKTLPKYVSELPEKTRLKYQDSYIDASYRNAKGYFEALITKHTDTLLGLKSRLFLGLLEYARDNYGPALDNFRDTQDAKVEDLGGGPARLAAAFYAARCQKYLALKQLEQADKNNLPAEDHLRQKAEKAYKGVFASLKNFDATGADLHSNPWFTGEDFISEVEEYAAKQREAASTNHLNRMDIAKRVELFDEAIDANKFLAQKFRQNRKEFLKKLFDDCKEKAKKIDDFISLSPLFADPETMRGEDVRRYYEMRRNAYAAAADVALRYAETAELNEALKHKGFAADYYRDLGQYDKMLKVAGQLVSDEKPENMLRLGQAWLGLGQYERAVEAFTKGLPKSGTHDVPSGYLPDNRYYVARALFYQSRQAADPAKKFELTKNALARLNEITDEDSGVEPNAQYYHMAKLLMGEIHFQRAEDAKSEKSQAGAPASVSADAELAETIRDLGAAIRRIEEEVIKRNAEYTRNEARTADVEWTAFIDEPLGLDVSHYYLLGEALLRSGKFNQAREAFGKLQNLYQPPTAGEPRWRSNNPWAPEWRILALKRAASSYVIEGDKLLALRKDKEADRCWTNAITQFDTLLNALRDSDPEETANLQRMIGDTYARYGDAFTAHGPSFKAQVPNCEDRAKEASIFYKRSSMQRKIGTVAPPLFRTKRESDTYEQWREFQKNMYDKMQQYAGRINQLSS